ncbi:MAG TPA: type II toxin-antitoxin system HicA family toxin [Chloroflexota bacterium]|nr:type II toxin-antitoxin system HicA family toxin [Chloroflexota bacterium]
MGFRRVRQRGSHVILRRDRAEGSKGCVVPLHRELAVGTLRSIVRQAGVTVEELTGQL